MLDDLTAQQNNLEVNIDTAVEAIHTLKTGVDSGEFYRSRTRGYSLAEDDVDVDAGETHPQCFLQVMAYVNSMTNTISATNEDETLCSLTRELSQLIAALNESFPTDVARVEELVPIDAPHTRRRGKGINEGAAYWPNEIRNAALVAYKSLLNKQYSSDGEGSTNMRLTNELLNLYPTAFVAFYNVVQEELKLTSEHIDVEVVARSLYPSRKLFEAKRRQNRTELEAFFRDMEMPFTVSHLDSAFQIITKNLFFGKYAHIRAYQIQIGSDVQYAGHERSGLHSDQAQGICNLFNDAIALPAHVGLLDIEFQKCAANFFINLINEHPFFDWNGTMGMMLTLALTARRYGTGDFSFVTNNTDMILKMFDNNPWGLFFFTYQMLKNNFVARKDALNKAWDKAQRIFRG